MISTGDMASTGPVSVKFTDACIRHRVAPSLGIKNTSWYNGEPQNTTVYNKNTISEWKYERNN